MIGGFILDGSDSAMVLVRAIIFANDNWRSDQEAQSSRP